MKKVSLDVWIQLFGMVGIIGSLVFVGLEMRQSQRIAISAQHQQRGASAVAMIVGFLEGGEDWDATVRPDSINDMEIARRNAHQINWYFVENDFNQYQNGLLPDNDWAAKINVLEFLLSECDLRPIVDFRQRFWSADFMEVINSIDDPCI